MGLFDSVVKKIEKSIENAVDSVTQIDATIDFRNETDQEIKVTMDGNREVHTIAPHGRATFSEANVGDMPTFRVFNSSGAEVFGRKINPVVIKSSLGWNGNRF